MKSKDKICMVIVAAIAFGGVVSHAMIASQSVERRVLALGERFGVADGHSGNPSNVVANPVLIPLGTRELTLPRDGVYLYSSSQNDGFAEVMHDAGEVALGMRPQTFGWFVPLPFLFVGAAHVGFVLAVTKLMALKMGRGRVVEQVGSVWDHALRSAIYAYPIVVMFQVGRMFWGAEAWQSRFFMSHAYGWAAFYIYSALWGAIYLYCVVSTARYKRAVLPMDGHAACVQCGFDLSESDRECPECGTGKGQFVASTLTLNHLLLLGFGMVAVFSPVFVASVYAVMSAG